MVKELNDIMEFDHIIRVAEDGTITEPRDVHGYFDLNVATDGTDEFDMSEGWTLLSGFTGQYSYNGPVMHPSEFIGGGLERHIRETPGYYVALVVEGRCDYDGTTDCDVEQGCNCEPAGWAVAYKPLETHYCSYCRYYGGDTLGSLEEITNHGMSHPVTGEALPLETERN